MSYSNYYTDSQLYHGSMSPVMGTELDVLLIGGEEAFLSSVWQIIQTEVVRLNGLLSCFDEDSEVSKINREASVYAVNVSDELWQLLIDCKRYYESTEGCFDITANDFSKVLLNDKDKSIYFLAETLKIDLGGIGKGYALKKISEILEREKVTRALVNFGNSSVLAVGTHPCGDYWPVGIDNPFTHERMDNLRLHDNTLTTSGNTPTHPKHIINPKTGMFVEEHKMASVIGPDPVAGEALSTALMVADEKSIPAIMKKFDLYEIHLYKLC
ncbi:MAG: FAD:protein FMN transferase [Parabacteroides sp.]|nr:FAD:protein FMN transferase [Parabacteroides sp.]